MSVPAKLNRNSSFHFLAMSRPRQCQSGRNGLHRVGRVMNGHVAKWEWNRVVCSSRRIVLTRRFVLLLIVFFPFLGFPPSHVVLPSVLFFSYCTDASFRAVYCQHASVRIVALEVRFFNFKVRHSKLITSSKFSITRQGLFQEAQKLKFLARFLA